MTDTDETTATDLDGRSPVITTLTRGLWLLPVFGALTLWATIDHQPDPTTSFRSWSEFVTTGHFLAGHLLGSIGGQVAYLLGSAALAGVLLITSPRVTTAITGFVLSVVGSVGLVAGFGVAAFAQPAIGRLHLDGHLGAQGVYDDVYATPALITLLGGALLFAAGSVVTARAVAATGVVPRWSTVIYASSGPLIAVVGVAVGQVQTLGALAALTGGAGIATSLSRHRLRPWTKNVNRVRE
jgi:hypothetical protein